MRCRGMLMGTGLVVVAGVLGVADVRSAHGQCAEGWSTLFGGPVGTNGDVTAMTRWDPDGDGPLGERLVLGGTFTRAGGVVAERIALWDGEDYTALSPGPQGLVTSLATWQRSSTAGAPAALAVLASATFDGVSGRAVWVWEEGGWSTIPARLTGSPAGSIFSMFVWDPDGDGPLPAGPLIAGSFREVEGVPALGVAWWNGTSWTPVGSGLDGGVSQFVTVDPDGDGPMSSRLFATGSFTLPGSASAERTAMWDGSEWVSLNGGPDGTVSGAVAWDPDGDGPLGERLVIGGSFTSAGGQAVAYVAAWDGASWSAIGPALPDRVVRLSVGRSIADSAGETSVGLAAIVDSGTASVRGFYEFDGAAWTQRVGSVVNTSVRLMIAWDPDADGPLDERLYFGGTFERLSTVRYSRLAQWDGVALRPCGLGLNDSVADSAVWDPDGDGPEPARLVVVGSFTHAGEETLNGVAYWDGARWRPLATILGLPNGSFGLNAVVTWDPDGPGPEREVLAVGGRFFHVPGETALSRVASWDGTAWRGYAGVSGSSILAIGSYDHDGDGTQSLIVGGEFLSAQGTWPSTAGYRWDGVRWNAIGDLGAVSGRSVSSYLNWTPPGSTDPRGLLVIAGDFSASNQFSGPASLLGCVNWDGMFISGLGAGPNQSNTAFVWDRDGPGPLPETLVAATIGSSPTSGVVWWTGTEWAPLGGDASGQAVSGRNTGTAWDADGSGPEHPSVVIGGSFSAIQGVAAQAIARWTGSAWQSLGDTMVPSYSVFSFAPVVNELRSFEPDGEGAVPPLLFAGGAFSAVDGRPAGHAAAYARAFAPVVVRQTGGPVTVCAGERVELLVEAYAAPTADLRWARNGASMMSGSTGRGSSVWGTRTGALTILNAQPGDSGSYVCVIENACGTAESVAVEVVVLEAGSPGCGSTVACPADVNVDGSIDLLDLLAFIGAWSGNLGRTDAGAQTPGNFDGDSRVDLLDLTAFLASWSEGFGGGCP